MIFDYYIFYNKIDNLQSELMSEDQDIITKFKKVLGNKFTFYSDYNLIISC